MKKILLLNLLLALTVISAYAQTCNTFANTTGLSQYPDPSTEVNYSVGSNELTLTFTGYVPWGNEVKWTLPTPIDITGISSAAVTYDVSVVNLTVNGTGCGTVNYVPLGISVVDENNDYSTGTASNGYFDVAFTGGYNIITTTDALVDYTKIAAISIKLASAGCTVSSINGVLKIKNLCIAGTPANKLDAVNSLVNSINLFPNPSEGSVQIELNLPQVIEGKVVIQDLMGKTVMTLMEGSIGTMSSSFETVNLKQGIYNVLVLVDGSVAQAKKLVIE